jgi:hypothetical protein
MYSAWLDSQLNPQEISIIEGHLLECADCKEEFNQWQILSNSLKELGKNTLSIQAPEGFGDQVMLKISKVARYKRWNNIQWFNINLRTVAASVAALAILTYGTIDLAPKVFNWNSKPSVANHETENNIHIIGSIDGVLPPPGTVGAPLNPDNSTDNTNPDPQTTPGDTALIPGEEDLINNENPSVALLPSEPISNGNNELPSSMRIAQADVKEPIVFLNRERTITSTLLQMEVDNLIVARNTAQTASNKAGAKYKVFNLPPAGDSQRIIMRFTVPSTKIDSFMTALMGLGEVIDQQNEDQNITARFADTLEQYRNLTAQLNETKDSQLQTQIKNQIKSLEQQLLIWDEEAQERIIMLSLEMKTK